MTASSKDCAIARIESWACSLPLKNPLDLGIFKIYSREYVALRVTTRGGLEAHVLGLSRRSPIDVAITDVLAPSLLGKDGIQVDARLGDIRSATKALEADGVLGRASSLLECCFWDLAAQVSGVPLWRLLGGRARSLAVQLVEGYRLPDEDDRAFAERLAARAAEGYGRLKIEAGSYRDPEQLRARLEHLRRLAGSKVQLVIDAGWKWSSVPDALESLSCWRDLGIDWVEDPFARSAVLEHAELRARSGIQIGAGDEATRAADLSALLAGQGIDVLRLDATAVGGIESIRRLGERAAQQAVRISLHERPELHRHCALMLPQCDHVEAFPLDRDFDAAHRLLQNTPLREAAGGTIEPPATSGSGIRLDLDAVNHHAYRHHEVQARGPAAPWRPLSNVETR
jgi:L-alanine-DL-glutamate epimerase-like enolase superfamily enzyme